MENYQEPVWGTFCMKCDHDKEYYEGQNVPESCPACGEHKEFSLVDLEELRN
jgi:hypothetical protein